jgi:hypothetical protein
MTKAQKKRAVVAIWKKIEKLYFQRDAGITTKDLQATRRMCDKWLNKIG